MNSIVSTIVATLLLLHTVLGCCWHPQDATNFSDDVAAVTSSCCHESHHSEHSNGTPKHPCHADCHGVCNYLPTQKVKVVAPQLVLPLMMAAILPTVACCDPTLSINGVFQDQTNSAAPVRLHLLHQILLI